MLRESRQGGVTRSEMTRRTVHTARTSLGKLENRGESARVIESSSVSQMDDKLQAICEKCILRFFT